MRRHNYEYTKVHFGIEFKQMKSIEIDDFPLGRISLTLLSQSTDKVLRIYVGEFLGNATPPAELEGVVDGFITFPGYGNNPLHSNVSGSLLTWEHYGKALSLILAKLSFRPVGLLGNSMGAMTSIYAALEDPSLIDHLVLYKIPNFGDMRKNISGKYNHVSESIIDEKSFQIFVRKAQGKVDDNVMAVLESLKWKDAKKLYLGAAKSNLNLENISILAMPIYFLENPIELDAVHPLEAQEYLFTLMTGASTKKRIQASELREKAGSWVTLNE